MMIEDAGPPHVQGPDGYAVTWPTFASGARDANAQDKALLTAAPDLLRVACELAEALEDRDGGVHDPLCGLMVARARRPCRCGHEEALKALATFRALVDPE